MFSKLRGSFKGKEKELPSVPYSSTSPTLSYPTSSPSSFRYDPYSSTSSSSPSSSKSTSTYSESLIEAFSRSVISSPEKDEEFALLLQLAEDEELRLRTESDERMVREMIANEMIAEQIKVERDEELLRAFVESEKKEEEERKAKEEREWVDLVRQEEEEVKKRAKGKMECEVCYGENEDDDIMVQCPDGHILCQSCAKQGATVAFSMLDARLPCLVDGNCTHSYPPEECHKFLDAAQWKRFEELRLESDVSTVQGLVRCPFCTYGVINEAEDLEIFYCLNPDCSKRSCLKCKRLEHPSQTCVEANPSPTQKMEEAMSNELIRKCPKCEKKFVKSGGCNMITCQGSACGAKSCYLCKQLVTDYNHFSTPGTPCNGKLYKDDVVTERVEQVRKQQAKLLQTEEEKKHAEKLKIRK